MTINTAEIEARLADMIANGVTVTSTGDLEISDDLIATLAATESALKAETARADKEGEHTSLLMRDNAEIRAQLTAANEKLAAMKAGQEALLDELHSMTMRHQLESGFNHRTETFKELAERLSNIRGVIEAYNATQVK